MLVPKEPRHLLLIKLLAEVIGDASIGNTLLFESDMWSMPLAGQVVEQPQLVCCQVR